MQAQPVETIQAANQDASGHLALQQSNHSCISPRHQKNPADCQEAWTQSAWCLHTMRSVTRTPVASLVQDKDDLCCQILFFIIFNRKIIIF